MTIALYVITVLVTGLGAFAIRHMNRVEKKLDAFPEAIAKAHARISQNDKELAELRAEFRAHVKDHK